MDNTQRRLATLFYCKELKDDVVTCVCAVYQSNKHDNSPSSGLLQPLVIPKFAWSSISMDFTDGLPNSKGKTTILEVVDRLTKYGHSLGPTHPYTAALVAQLFLDQILKLHRMLENIVSDRDPIFISRIWQEIFSLHGVTLSRSLPYHSQSYGQTEVLDRTLETYVRCYCSDR